MFKGSIFHCYSSLPGCRFESPTTYRCKLTPKNEGNVRETWVPMEGGPHLNQPTFRTCLNGCQARLKILVMKTASDLSPDPWADPLQGSREKETYPTKQNAGTPENHRLHSNITEWGGDCKCDRSREKVFQRSNSLLFFFADGNIASQIVMSHVFCYHMKRYPIQSSKWIIYCPRTIHHCKYIISHALSLPSQESPTCNGVMVGSGIPKTSHELVGQLDSQSGW